MGIFDLWVFDVIWGSFGAFALQMACDSKIADRRASRLKFGLHVADIFDLVVLQVLLGSCGALFQASRPMGYFSQKGL